MKRVTTIKVGRTHTDLRLQSKEAVTITVRYEAKLIGHLDRATISRRHQKMVSGIMGALDEAGFELSTQRVK